jgi:hypothetical protein
VNVVPYLFVDDVNDPPAPEKLPEIYLIYVLYPVDELFVDALFVDIEFAI